jgi:hypothetical protein
MSSLIFRFTFSVFGVKPRDAFVPSAREGMCVFACDYSQKEVRILAHMRYVYYDLVDFLDSTLISC